ncbi:Mariner Mos1 transposase [Eumeta japonica]|uniref:Mariner Mos1 transposase n=1 Tax=Eumeta variegata TaxID=151549 RepID=A0A4C1Z4Z7_EUMVA|nr:Mariner Mos1 transposase [Eumeta japonica]
MVNSEWYTTICLAEVFEEMRNNHQQRRKVLHHDNAKSHTTLFSEGQKIKWMSHPLYSPDLTPNYFYLFPSVKNKLLGQRFSSPEEAVEAFKIFVLEIPQSE